MKYKSLKLLAIARQWANGEVGEKYIVKILTILLGLWVLDLALLIVGSYV